MYKTNIKSYFITLTRSIVPTMLIICNLCLCYAQESLKPVEISDENMASMISSTLSKFSDIKETDWYTRSIAKLHWLGGVTGYPDATFRPKNPVTMAEYLKLLLAALDQNQDESGQIWYQNYVNRALEIGAIEDTDNYLFTDILQRKDSVKILCKVLGIKQQEFEESIFFDLKFYKDLKPSWIYAAFHEYLVVGEVANGKRFFRPYDGITRAEAVEIVVRALEYRNSPDQYKEKMKKKVHTVDSLKKMNYFYSKDAVQSGNYPSEVNDYLSKNGYKESQKVIKANNKTYIIFTMGERPTSEFFINLLDMHISENKILFIVNYIRTGAELHTHTFPVLILELGEEYKNFSDFSFEIRNLETYNSGSYS